MPEALDYELVNWLLWAAKTGITWAVGVFAVALIVYIVALIALLVKARKTHKEMQARVQKNLAQRGRIFVGDPSLPE